MNSGSGAIEAAWRWMAAHGEVQPNPFIKPDPTPEQIADWRTHVARCGIAAKVIDSGFPEVEIEIVCAGYGVFDRMGEAEIGGWITCRCDQVIGHHVSIKEDSAQAAVDRMWEGR